MAENMPTAQDMEAGAEVIEAGEQAAAAETDPTKRRGAATRAIRSTAKSKGWEISAEQADMLAGMVATKLADALSEVPALTADEIGKRGGYDKLPEPLSIPAAPTPGGSLPEQPAAAPPDVAPGSHKRSFANWFRGGSS